MNLAFRIAKDVEKVFHKSKITPRDTGNLQDDGITSVEVSKHKAYVVIGGTVAPYAYWLQFNENVGRTTVVNRHKGFVNKIVHDQVIPKLMTKYKAKREE